METTDHATEGDPLKRGEDGLETVAAPSGAEQKMKKKKSCKEILAFVRANHWRTAVFFFSLFLCLTIVFAFSFILPCPVRPQYLISWNRSFSHAGLFNSFTIECWLFFSFSNFYFSATETYDFLAVESASEDQVMDVTFVVKMSESSKNCTDEGMKQEPREDLILNGSLSVVLMMVAVVSVQVCLHLVCLWLRWMGQMARHCGSVHCGLSSTGLSVVCRPQNPAEPGTVCSHILTKSLLLTKKLVGDFITCPSLTFYLYFGRFTQ